MLEIEIPGKGKINIENIVFDYNGTLALNGKLDEKAKSYLLKLKELVDIYILTADTYGTVIKECKEGCCSKLLNYADIVVCSIDDLFGLFFNTSRIKATLRS